MVFLNTHLNADDLFIEAKDISLNKNNETTIFKNNVVIKSKDKKINSEFAEYNRETEKFVIRKNLSC